MQLINTGPEPFFEDVVNHMAAICHVPLALVALCEPERFWINEPDAERGIEAEAGRVEQLRPLGTPVAPATQDASGLAEALSAARAGRYFSHLSHPLVIGGRELGTLHLADTTMREWGLLETGYLARAARLVAGHLEARATLTERDARAQLERRLAEAGELHSAVVNAMADGVVVLSGTGQILSYNLAAQAILGLSDDSTNIENASAFTLDVIDWEGRRMELADYPVIRAMQTGVRQSSDLGVVPPSGELRWLKASAIPLHSSEESSGWTVALTFTDITESRRQMEELKAARAEAEAANRAKSSFLANMSHEIRTPLNGVLGMAQVLGETALDAEQRAHVRTILDSGRTLMTLLNDVLDLLKIEAGKFDIVPADCSLDDMLRSLLALWSPRAAEKGLDLKLMLDAGGPERLCFDSVRVQQCLTNFVSNAIKFTARGEVTIRSRVRTCEAGYEVEIDVVDTGEGIDAGTLERLFSPFVQADETTSRRHGGTGLGLSITRRLAELMGGDATARSERGRGSIFTLTFIAREASTQADTAPREAAEQKSQVLAPRVLLVDDHPVNRMVARLMLAPLRPVIVEAADGEQALARLDAEPFDVVLLDMHMPVMDGPSAIRRLREGGRSYANVPVIALTADAMSGDRERYLSLGMSGYIAKPLDQGELLHELERVLGSGPIENTA